MLKTLGNVCISTLKEIIKFFLCFSASEVTEQVILPAVESSSPSFKPHFVKSICAVQVSLPGAPWIDAYTAVLNKDNYNGYERFDVFHCVLLVFVPHSCWSSLNTAGCMSQTFHYPQFTPCYCSPTVVTLWCLYLFSPEWPNPTITPVIIELNGWTAAGIYGWHLGTGQISQPMKQLV